MLMVLAHCDDEIVCGWPIMQSPSIRKHILMVSSDRNNVSREWCAHRKFVFMDICRDMGVETTVFDFDSDFHATSPRGGGLLALERRIGKVLADEASYDYVFTHNPFGEYGHHDHRYLFQVTSQLARKPVLITDICMQSDWTEANAMTDRLRAMYFRECIGESRLDNAFYEKVKQRYALSNVWTWNQRPASSCRLYVV